MMQYETKKYVEGVKELKEVCVNKISSDMDIHDIDADTIRFIKMMSDAVDASNAMVLEQAKILDKLESDLETVLNILKTKTKTE